MSNDDFLSRRRAAIEREANNVARFDRISPGVPIVAECIKRLRAAGLNSGEIAGLLRHAATELEA